MANLGSSPSDWWPDVHGVKISEGHWRDIWTTKALIISKIPLKLGLASIPTFARIIGWEVPSCFSPR